MFIGTIKVRDFGETEEVESDKNSWTEELMINEKRMKLQTNT